jgi:hypothetical protein
MAVMTDWSKTVEVGIITSNSFCEGIGFFVTLQKEFPLGQGSRRKSWHSERSTSGELLVPVLLRGSDEQILWCYRFDAKRRGSFAICITCSGLDAMITSFSSHKLLATLILEGFETYPT